MGCCNSKEAQSPELAPDNSDLGYGITGSGKNGVKNDGMEYGRDGQISPQSMNNYEKQDSQATFHGINQQLSNPYNNYAQYGDEHFHGELQHQGQGQRQRAGSTPERNADMPCIFCTFQHFPDFILDPRNYMEPTASGRARSNSSSQDPFRRVPSNGMPGSMSDPRLMPPRSANSTPDIGTDKLVPQHLVKPRGTSRVFTQSMIGSDFKISRPLSPQVGTPQSSPFHSSSPPNFHDNFGQSPPNSANSAYHPQPLGYPPQSSNQPRQQPQMRTIAQHETSRSPSPQPHQTTNPTNLTHQATNQSSQQGLPQRQTTIQGHTIMVKKEPSLKAQPAKGLLRVKGAGPSPLSSSNSPQQPIRSSTADSGDTEDDDDYLPRAGSVMHTQVNVEVRQAQIRQEPIEEDLSLPRAGSVVRSNVNVEVQQIQSTKGAALSQDLAQQQPKATSAPSQAAPQEKVVATAPSQITLQPSLVDDEEAEGEEGEDIDYGDDIFNKYRLSVASTFVPSLARPGKNNRLSIVPPKPAPDFAAARMAPEEKSFALSENTVASNTAATYPDFYSEDEDEDEDENEDEEEVEIEDDEVVVEEEDYFDFDGYIDQERLLRRIRTPLYARSVRKPSLTRSLYIFWAGIGIFTTRGVKSVDGQSG
ncbi:hypothetical protein BC829DRAFT_105204 [Chytridium lagenaria]|nr:hypothetical protein BC829DRAFT_105204 [Chytridium lagenaria]